MIFVATCMTVRFNIYYIHTIYEYIIALMQRARQRERERETKDETDEIRINEMVQNTARYAH